jgi:predicted nucleic acid-binding protein
MILTGVLPRLLKPGGLRAVVAESALTRRQIHLDALDRYRKTKVHFVDCTIDATALAENTPVATPDQDFRKFADVHVEIQ